MRPCEDVPNQNNRGRNERRHERMKESRNQGITTQFRNQTRLGQSHISNLRATIHVNIYLVPAAEKIEYLIPWGAAVLRCCQSDFKKGHEDHRPQESKPNHTRALRLCFDCLHVNILRHKPAVIWYSTSFVSCASKNKKVSLAPQIVSTF
jgi:hypothetical protein